MDVNCFRCGRVIEHTKLINGVSTDPVLIVGPHRYCEFCGILVASRTDKPLENMFRRARAQRSKWLHHAEGRDLARTEV